MKNYKVLLTRSYIVTIYAEDIDQAKNYTEFYLGDCPDLSKPRDRKNQKFKIKEIEMALNEAYEATNII
ncbi:MAG: hypothetical protein IID16_12110 [Candidatus Marinimicrobia bacterium]|nr:hypothetical protein [Candidatus Neomarinimicrobiota bacterium]